MRCRGTQAAGIHYYDIVQTLEAANLFSYTVAFIQPPYLIIQFIPA